MEIHRTEGVVVQLVKFRDYDLLATLFTPDVGLLKFILYGGSGTRQQKRGVLSPMTKIELSYTLQRGDLATCKEWETLNSFHSLRQDLPVLESASAMIRAVLTSQGNFKASADLYRLFISYLEALSVLDNPTTLSSSFLLKILRHEGLFHLREHCSQCDLKLDRHWIDQGENLCIQHASHTAIEFSEEDIKLLTLLAYGRSLKEIAFQQINSELQRKILALFHWHW